MASIAGQSARGLFALEVRLVARAALDRFAGGRASGTYGSDDSLTVRALAGAGLAAMAGLPLLMLASLGLGAPLAAPAGFALGYLAIAHAVSSRQPRRAAVLSVAVFSAFAGWTLLFGLTGQLHSWPGFVSALMAPAFAGAPALGRLLLVRLPKAEASRSEEHTSELQSRQYLVCRLLLEKKYIPPPLAQRP